MLCNLQYDNIIFNIHKISRIDQEYYVFIGNVEENIYNILKKIENRKNIIKEEVKILIENYKDYYINWIKIVKQKIKIKFIPIKIQIDDSLSDIRKKIFTFCSEPEKKIYYLPENQEIFFKKNNNDLEVYGYTYYNSKNKTKIAFPPHFTKKINDTINLNESYIKKNTSENIILIYEIFDELKLKDTTIYFSDAIDEQKYILSKSTNINNNYFKTYWPFVNLSYNLTEIKNMYILLKEYYTKENYIHELMLKMQNNSNKRFGSCNILTVVLASKEDEEEKKKENIVDLYPIFDYLREKVLDEKIPFIKYYENMLDMPFSLISKKAIDDKLISKDILKRWIGNVDESRKMEEEIIIKRHLKNYDNQPRYISLMIGKYGKVNINISFLNSNHATFEDVQLGIKECKKIIENINKNRIIKKTGEKEKIETLDLDLINNKIQLKNNTKIVYMNIIIPLNLGVSLDFKKLGEFSKKFPYFLTEVPKDSYITDQKQENSIIFKYKRVSAFANMNDILLEIDKLKQKYDKDSSFIIKALEKKFQKSVDEIKLYLIEWEKKYSLTKSVKIASELKTGIRVSITDHNILISGITKTYQIPLIYRFFVTFLTLFINYDNLNKDFKKIILSKNNKSVQYNQYEYNNNVKLDINKIYEEDYDIDDDYFLDDDIENIKNMYETTSKLNISKQNIIGMAEDIDIDPNLKLKCNDVLLEKDTCTDFCNDKNYFLRRLQRYDIHLFRPKTNKKNKNKVSRYSRQCIVKGQPVVLPYDPEKNPNIKRDSYTYSVKYSSNPDVFQRWYICPKIWCPYCEIPILESDIDSKTIKIRSTKDKGGLCTIAKCPNGDHQVFVRSLDSKKYIYPGFLHKSDHPDNLCYPCCFINSHDNPKSAFYSTFKKCLGDDYENKNIKEGQIYILTKGFPLDKDRYGKLNTEINRILKTNLETGYLGENKGYLRKGIKQEKNNYFLSAICDILSCDKKNKNINVEKIKGILIEKLNENLFTSLYGGNLPNIFYNPKSNLTPIENFKKYIMSKNVILKHKYLWDFLQRENILFEDGVNIFIFENNYLLCPKGENSEYFYNINRKSILLIKHKDYYEPIYYVVGGIKNNIETCIFNNSNEELKKLFEIVENSCKPIDKIDWISLLKDNIKKYDLNIDNLSINNGKSLEETINCLLKAIYNKKLSNDFLPEWQYIDSYNKVFAITLQNNLYLPVSPSKLLVNMKYKMVKNIYDIQKLDFKNTLKLTKKVDDICKLDCKINYKMLDLKNKKYIIALLNENNRVIPIKEIVNNDKKLKISNFNYYGNVDEALESNIEEPDKRVEIINKKNFEDETLIRMKFELSKFLQISKNKNYYDQILNIIYSDEKDIKINRKKLYSILDEIFSKLLIIKELNIDYNLYKTPNKRIPCFLRNIDSKYKSNTNNNISFSCEDDDHCVIHEKKCKLGINKYNLLSYDKNIKNYEYYLAKINDELLRFNIKRTEILNDNIPVIINKEIIQENPNKYIIIHSLNNNEIVNIIDKLYLDAKEIFVDDKKLYETTSTKDVSFKQDKYLKTSSNLYLQNNSFENLSLHWDKYLGNKFKVKLNGNNTIFGILSYILNNEQIKNNENNIINISSIKNKIIFYIKNTLLKKNGYNEEDIINMYKECGLKEFKYILSLDELIGEFVSDTYFGCYIDLKFISNIFNINIIVLDKRLKKNVKEYMTFLSENKNNYYVLLYKTIYVDMSVYNLIQYKNKVLISLKDLPNKFIDIIF